MLYLSRYRQITCTFKFRPGYIPTDSNIYTIIEHITNDTGRDTLCGIYQDLLPNQIVYLVLPIIKSRFLYLVTQLLLLVILTAAVAYNRYRSRNNQARYVVVPEYNVSSSINIPIARPSGRTSQGKTHSYTPYFNNKFTNIYHDIRLILYFGYNTIRQ
jgi:hypothetical protein